MAKCTKCGHKHPDALSASMIFSAVRDCYVQGAKTDPDLISNIMHRLWLWDCVLRFAAAYAMAVL